MEKIRICRASDDPFSHVWIIWKMVLVTPTLPFNNNLRPLFFFSKNRFSVLSKKKVQFLRLAVAQWTVFSMRMHSKWLWFFNQILNSKLKLCYCWNYLKNFHIRVQVTFLPIFEWNWGFFSSWKGFGTFSEKCRPKGQNVAKIGFRTVFF